MDDFIGCLVADAGVDRAATEQAAGILQFLIEQAPTASTRARIIHHGFGVSATTPASVSSTRSSSPRSFGRHVMPAVLGMGGMQGIGPVTTSFTRETAGDHAVGRMVGAIPGRSA
jgi:hypothetical protein